jgi:hypothetical protein
MVYSKINISHSISFINNINNMKNLFKNISKFTLIFSFLILAPVATFAQGFVGPCPAGTVNNGSGCVPASGIGSLMAKAQQLLNSVIPILIALGVVYFVWGVVQYVIADGEEAKSKGKDIMIYGVIGFAVIIGLWGFVNIIVKTFGFESTTAPELVKLSGVDASCTLGNNPKFQDLLCYVTKIINDSVIPLIFALATVMFVWGAVNFFIINADEEAKRAEGKQFMVWGIVALAVMLSVWGLVGIVSSTFGINGNILPQVKPPGSSN